MNAAIPAQGRWAVSVSWHDSLLPNDATRREWIAAVCGRILLPAAPEPVGCANLLTAQVVVEANTLRQAVAAGLGRVEKGVGCQAVDVRATRLRTGDRNEDVFAAHALPGRPPR